MVDMGFWIWTWIFKLLGGSKAQVQIANARSDDGGHGSGPANPELTMADMGSRPAKPKLAKAGIDLNLPSQN